MIHANPPTHCDICKGRIGTEFFDHRTKFGPWADSCRACFVATHFDPKGTLGIGKGQHYRLQPDGKFHLIEGGSGSYTGGE